ncbi:MAG: DUF5698 domain-containing protein [bacterium]|nr:DUF5698 domain-containing protein [bacterium]
MILFFIGVVEMVIISTWTKAVTETKVIFSGIVTLVNVFIWYYVLETVINDITNTQVIIQYASGCALGTMLSTAYFSRQASKKKKLVGQS